MHFTTGRRSSMGTVFEAGVQLLRTRKAVFDTTTLRPAGVWGPWSAFRLPLWTLKSLRVHTCTTYRFQKSAELSITRFGVDAEVVGWCFGNVAFFIVHGRRNFRRNQRPWFSKHDFMFLLLTVAPWFLEALCCDLSAVD